MAKVRQNDKVQVTCGCCERAFTLSKEQLTGESLRPPFSIGHLVQQTYARKHGQKGSVHVKISVEPRRHDLCADCAMAAVLRLVKRWSQVTPNTELADLEIKLI